MFFKVVLLIVPKQELGVNVPLRNTIFESRHLEHERTKCAGAQSGAQIGLTRKLPTPHNDDGGVELDSE